MENKIQEIYLTFYIILIAHDLWHIHYQILSIIFLKEFIKLSLNTNRKDDKKCEISKSNISIVTIFFDAQTLKIIK